jgi:2-iminobutanoate/2-iminopropanoate deaminase
MREVIETDKAPAAIGPYSQGIKQEGFIFTSGQLPVGPSGQLITDDIAAATEQCLKNIRAVLGAADARLDDVIKVTIYLVDMGNFGEVNNIYEGFFTTDPPARSCVQVAGLPKGAPIEIEAVAHIK